MKFLEDKIAAGKGLDDFLVAISSRVFFWPTLERLERLRNAREYRAEEQVILHISTRQLMERHESRIELCRFNSGAITQRKPPSPRSQLMDPSRSLPT